MFWCTLDFETMQDFFGFPLTVPSSHQLQPDRLSCYALSMSSFASTLMLP